VLQPDALDLRLRATALFFGSIAPENTLETRRLLQRSAALDPGSAETWARLGEIVASDYLTGWNSTGEQQLGEAEDAVRRTLLIDLNHALARVAHGLIQRARGEHHAALEAFTPATELDRNFAFAYAHKGNQLILVGRPAEAPAFVEQAIRLSPYDPSIGVFHWINRAVVFLHRAIRSGDFVAAEIRRDQTQRLVQPALSGQRLCPRRRSGSSPTGAIRIQSPVSGTGFRNRPTPWPSSKREKPPHRTTTRPSSPRKRSSTTACYAPVWRNADHRVTKIGFARSPALA
jgi:tetratricopeptide (TPR) repeat protein